MSGEARGPAAGVARAALRIAAGPYAWAMRQRNGRYDRTGGTPLGRPTVSVGNITAGGTGKTPVVRWLTERLIADGHTPAVLLRGYKRAGGQLGDEGQILARWLDVAKGKAVVAANPDRLAAAAAVLRDRPHVDVFVLDDAFQHRRAARDFDLVLINATQPFGHGYVHPRGLLREPLEGLARASAILLTHADEVTPQQLQLLESQINRFAGAKPTFRARHVCNRLLRTTSRGADEHESLGELRRERFFVIAGVGHPAGVKRIVDGPGLVGTRWFADHHAYSTTDWRAIVAAARDAGAAAVVMTEKDWAKLSAIAAADPAFPVWRIDLRIAFESEDAESRLYAQIVRLLNSTCIPALAPHLVPRH